MRLADVQFSTQGHTVVARINGEVDLSNAEKIGSSITEEMPNHAHVLILDLTSVSHLDSAGIQLIYRLREDLRTRGQSLRLVIPEGSPSRDALRLAGVERHVETNETVDELLDQLTR